MSLLLNQRTFLPTTVPAMLPNVVYKLTLKLMTIDDSFSVNLFSTVFYVRLNASIESGKSGNFYCSLLLSQYIYISISSSSSSRSKIIRDHFGHAARQTLLLCTGTR